MGDRESGKSIPAADSSKENAGIQNLEQAASKTQSTLVTGQGRQLHPDECEANPMSPGTAVHNP